MPYILPNSLAVIPPLYCLTICSFRVVSLFLFFQNNEAAPAYLLESCSTSFLKDYIPSRFLKSAFHFVIFDDAFIAVHAFFFVWHKASDKKKEQVQNWARPSLSVGFCPTNDVFDAFRSIFCIICNSHRYTMFFFLVIYGKYCAKIRPPPFSGQWSRLLLLLKINPVVFRPCMSGTNSSDYNSKLQY